MEKILNTKDAIDISEELRKQKKSIVLAGGVFDILHLGHILFLEKAKKHGDFLFVLLESDQNAKRKKGHNRPIHNQNDRAFILSFLQTVDYVVNLPEMTNDQQYDKLIAQLKPTVIAATEGDKNNMHKKRQAKIIGSKVIFVIKRMKDQSTTKTERFIKDL